MTANQLILIGVSVVGLLTAQGIYYFVVYLGERRQAEIKRRLRSLAEPGDKRVSLFRERRIARSPGLDRLLRPLPLAQRMEKLLQQTDLSWTVAMVMGWGIVLAAGLTFLFLVAFRVTPLLALLGVPVGLAVPLLLVFNARAKRNQKLSSQLPDALEMVVRSLRAGHAITTSFKLVAEEMPSPIAVEFGRCFEEQKFGVDFREAVENMTERVPGNLDLKIFAVSLIVQRETGGNLVEILEQIATTIRERFKFYGKLRALTAEGRMSGIILGALPFLTLGAVSIFNPQYLVPLAFDPIGRIIALGGLVMWILGVLWMSRLVKVDY